MTTSPESNVQTSEQDNIPLEVKIEVEGLGYIWSPATLIKLNVDGTLLLKISKQHQFKKRTLFSGGEEEEFSACFSQIRPNPPAFGRTEYYISQKVELLLDSGWCPVVIKERLLGRKYTVSFECNKADCVCEYWQLRPSMLWKDKMWQIEANKDPSTKQRHSAMEEDTTKLVDLLFFGALFSREDEMEFCLSYCGENSKEKLKEIFEQRQILSQPDVSLGSKIVAYERCKSVAKQWVENDYGSIAELKGIVRNIKESDYFTSALMKIAPDKIFFKTARTKMWWDFENAPVGKSMTAADIYNNIKRVVQSEWEIATCFSIVGIGHSDCGIKPHWDALVQSGIELIDILPAGGYASMTKEEKNLSRKDLADKVIMVEMMAWAYPQDGPAGPGNIILATGDVDYTPIVKFLIKRGFNVHIIHHLDTSKLLVRHAPQKCLLWEGMGNGKVKRRE